MKKLSFFQGFLIFLLILSVGVGSGYLILYYLTPTTQVGQLIARVMTLLIAGIGIGLVCRLAIPVKNLFLKLIFGIFGSFFSILILDWFFPTTYSLFKESSIRIDWWSVREYTQIGCLLATTIFIAIIGKKKTVSIQRELPKSEIKKAAPQRKTAPTSASSVQQTKTKLATVSLNSPAKKKTVKRTTNQKKAAVKPIVKTTTSAIKVKTSSKSIAVKKKVPGNKTRSRKKNVKLMGTEEHRCPYCLEEVKKNDPRGIVICPDCGTWHHRDCWEITGSCQIAHKHEL